MYESASSNGPMNLHMPPPPLPPVVIPQNNNPIPTAMTSPMSGEILSPTSSGGFVRRAAPEPNKRALYVGGLDPRVTEEVLKQIFETTGHVQSVKIIPDKNVSRGHLKVETSKGPAIPPESLRSTIPLAVAFMRKHVNALRMICNIYQAAVFASLVCLTFFFFTASRPGPISEQRSKLRFRRVR